jgi:ABC-2 type transport system ATP-binding protein
LVAIQDLGFSYRRKPVFKGLTLNLHRGHIYGLLGKNGTGKSTLLRNIAGLLYPDKGVIGVMGFEPCRRQPSFLEKVFLVREEFHLGSWVYIFLSKILHPFSSVLDLLCTAKGKRSVE